MIVAELIVRTLRALGVREVVGYPGDPSVGVLEVAPPAPPDPSLRPAQRPACATPAIYRSSPLPRSVRPISSNPASCVSPRPLKIFIRNSAKFAVAFFTGLGGA